MAFDIAFWVLAVLAVVAALAVVTLTNIFRAALAMVACFFMVAGLYATLGADFLALIQLLIYVGAVSVLIILAVMLTRDVSHAGRASKAGLAAAIAFLLFGATVVFTLLNSRWDVAAVAEPQPTTAALGQILFGQSGFVLPLLIAAGLLLATIIGAMALIRDE